MQFLLNHLLEASLFLLWFTSGAIFFDRWAWSRLNGVRRYFYGTLTLLFFLSMLPVTFLRAFYFEEVELSQMSIYDAEKDIVIADLGGYDWLLNLLKPDEEKRYFFPAIAVEIHGNVSNITYIAELHLNEADFQAVKKAYLQGRNGFAADAIDTSSELNLAVSDCVKSLAMIPIKVEGEPKLAIRELSVTDMNERCPLAPKFGYKWVSLEVKLL